MKRVTLTFDNGPDSEGTETVLKTLEEYAIRSTFFVVGERMLDPALRRRAEMAHAAGHWIGNHSMTHQVPFGEDSRPDLIEREIASAQRTIGALAHPDRLFRPFGGGGHLDKRLLNTASRDYLVAEAYTCMLWNVVPRDWVDPDAWVERALVACAEQAWAVVVLHDHIPRAMSHLESFVFRLIEDGYTIVQDFPPACVPIRRGQIAGNLEHLVTV